jgi:hypothetical protein
LQQAKEGFCMSYLTSRGGRPVAAAALSLLCLLAAAAPAAWADGEDDPTFGNVGTSYVGLGADEDLLGDPDSNGPLPPRIDQAPDGAVWSALGLRRSDNERGSDAEFVRVVRMDAAGKPSGLDGDGRVDLDYGSIRRVLDIEVLSNGNAVVVTQAEYDDSRGGTGPLEVRTLDPAGNEVGSGHDFPSPELCDSSSGEARSADVDGAGRVFVAWDNCDGDAVLTRYTGDDELEHDTPVEDVVEIGLGPSNRLYVLSPEMSFQGKQRLPFFPVSLVSLYDTESLESDGTYGDGGIATAPGSPIDMAVDPTGRAVVWSDPMSFVAGGRGPSEADAWHFFRFDTGGEPDDLWGEEGHAELEHPDFGDHHTCEGQRGFCGSERPSIIAQGDSKVIAVGYPPDEREEETVRGTETPREFRDRTIARLTTGGGLDTTWDGDGVRRFALIEPPDGFARYMTLGPPTLQADGKLLLPLFTAAVSEFLRTPTPPDGFAYGVSRIGLTPPGTAAVPQQAASSTVVAPRSCVSRRVFRIRLRTGRRKAERSAIKTVAVTVNGKTVPVSSGARRTAQVNLRNLPKGRFTVVIRMTLADGGKVRDTRRYRTCAPKEARELPALRTRRPRR